MAEPRFESDEVTWRERNPVYSAAALTLMSVVPALLVLGTRWEHLASAAPLSLLAGILLWSANFAPRERLGRLVINELGVFFNERRLTSRARVRTGALLREGDEAPIVRLTTSRGRIDLRVANPFIGRRILHALGQDGRPPESIRLPSRVFADPGRLARLAMFAIAIPALFPPMGLLLHAHPLVFAALAAFAFGAVAFVLANLLAETTVALADDGVRLRWLFRERTLGYDAIESVRIYQESRGGFRSSTERGISIVMYSGEVVRLPGRHGDSSDLDELCSRLRAAIAGEGRGAEATPDSVFRSRGRGVAEWLRALRALGSPGRADHRTAPMPHETFWRVVEDPEAALEARAGAAVALSSTLDDEGRTRLRVAAIGAPVRLRIALEAAASAADDAELEQALSEVEPARFLVIP